ncbi:hypothetical protein DUI87_21796 [Hirundo rustica rustica]|uniref:Uncharacterized protein n=1 Tax=Hirundo rustica rustica TaxID=333673 RepID=A0A3M0JL18_HIRRU|nr:hypothetical protein DUI87_21796 [Hirundo rustica rustica]
MGASNRLTQRPVRQQPGSASSWIGPQAWPGLQEQSRSSLGPWTPQQDHRSDFMVLSSFSEVTFLTTEHYDANSSDTEIRSGTKQREKRPLDLPEIEGEHPRCRAC